MLDLSRIDLEEIATAPADQTDFEHRWLIDRHPELISVWQTFRDVRAQRRAVEWLWDQGLIDDDVANRFAADHPDPGLP